MTIAKPYQPGSGMVTIDKSHAQAIQAVPGTNGTTGQMPTSPATFRSLENTQCFKEKMLNHEIVQKRSGSNTILDQLLAAIQADA